MLDIARKKMPKEKFKAGVEKRLYKVSVYLTFEEKEELLQIVGERKLSSILRTILFDWMRRNKS
jgi:hypothetical protein